MLGEPRGLAGHSGPAEAADRYGYSERSAGASLRASATASASDMAAAPLGRGERAVAQRQPDFGDRCLEPGEVGPEDRRADGLADRQALARNPDSGAS